MEKEEAAFENAKKNALSTEVLTCALKIAAETWQITVRERGERATNGAAKAEERRKERLEKIAELEKELEQSRPRCATTILRTKERIGTEHCSKSKRTRESPT